MLRPPPELRQVEGYGPDAGCGEGWEVCFDLPNAYNLAYDIHELMLYSQESYLLCGPGDGGVGSGI